MQRGGGGGGGGGGGFPTVQSLFPQSLKMNSDFFSLKLTELCSGLSIAILISLARVVR